MVESADEAIVRQTQAGDAEAFGILVGRYEAKITRYGKKFLSDIEDIRDIVQNIFMKAYVNIQSFNPTLSFSPWLYRIAHNEFVNELRKKNRRPFINVDFNTDVFFPHPIAPETADKVSDTRILKEALNKCLSLLDDKYREPLVLSYFEELEYKEIADILRIPVSTVGVRLSRGKEMLKKIYQEKYGKPQ